jgi:NAD(P)-dependent dehydrogenase (short-subunit alcohol dehydrogenase family)
MRYTEARLRKISEEMLADIDKAAIASAAAEFNAKGTQAIAVATDVTCPQAVEALADAAFTRFGRVDLLLNNAGVEAIGLSWELTAQQWERALAVNVAGPANAIRAFVPRLLASGEPATIANIGSLGSLLAVPCQSAYIASKHALLALTECLELELRSVGASVRACAVLPGTINTDIFRRASVSETAGAEHLELMQEILDTTGMEADEAAAIILEGIAAGSFWVSTHPDQLEHMAQRWGEHIATLSSPFAV